MSEKTCPFTWWFNGIYHECALDFGHQDPFHEDQDGNASQDPAPPWGPWGKGWPDHDQDQ